MSIPELKDAKTALEELSSEAESREIARMREMARIHWDSLIAGAKAEGMAEGKAEASLMLLKALLSAPETKAVSDARLAELTGLSVVEVAKARSELK